MEDSHSCLRKCGASQIKLSEEEIPEIQDISEKIDIAGEHISEVRICPF